MIEIKYTEVEEAIELLAGQVTKSGYKPDCLIGVVTGGLIPLALLAMKLKIKNVISVSVKSNKDSAGDTSGKKPVEIVNMPEVDLTGQSVLIIDDVIERGDTMAKTVEILSQKCKPKLIKTASLVVDTNLCQNFPDFYAIKQEKDWIVLPWEAASNFGDYKDVLDKI